jgi:hypothetical protein
VLFTLSVSPSTTNPAANEITIVGGPDATAHIVGTHNDPADLYGIILAFVAIALAILAARWFLGRRGSAAGR